MGREKDKARVREALASRWPLTCIDGIGGIGKTALALEIVSESLLASKGEIPADGVPTFDGFIWTTAKDRELTLNDVLDAIARTLDYPGIAQQPLEEKQDSIRRLLQSKRYLLIVDNFETVTDEAVRDLLLRLPEPSKALITSREQKLPQAYAVSLKGMEQGEALNLIRSEGRRLGLASVEKGAEAVLLRLYRATGGAPLAIKWAIGQIKQKGQSLDTVLAALHEARGDIFEEIFARSWSLLREEARCILMVMPLFATSASKAAIEAASNVDHFALDEGLGQLAEMWLVEASDELDEARRRYSIHPLTRVFAERQAAQIPQFTTRALDRLASWLLKFTTRARRDRAAFDSVELEFPNIMQVVRWCRRAGQWQRVIDFRYTLREFLRERDYWNEALEVGSWAMEAATALDDKATEAWCCVDPFGWVYRHRGELAEAKRWYELGLAKYRELPDEAGITWAELGLGDIVRQEGDLERAQAIFEGTLACLQQGHFDTSYLSTLLHLSRLAGAQGQFEKSEQLGRQALELADIQDPVGVAGSLELVGRALYMQGKLDEAEQFFRKSLDVNERHRMRHGIAWNKTSLALLEEKRGNLQAALSLAREADDLQHKLAIKGELEETRELIRRLEEKLAMDRETKAK